MSHRSWITPFLVLLCALPRAAYAGVPGDTSAPLAPAPDDPPPPVVVIEPPPEQPPPEPPPTYVPVQNQDYVAVGFAPPPPVDPFSQPRVRVGFTIFGGPSVPSGRSTDAGGFGGVSARLGLQLDRTYGVYYQASALIGGYAFVTPTDTYTTVFAALYNTVCGSFTLFDHLDFGLGLSVDNIGSISTNTSSGSGGGSASITAFGGTGFGMHARIAIIMGYMNPVVRNRSGFTLSVDLHPTFLDGRVLFTTAIGIGGEWL